MTKLAASPRQGAMKVSCHCWLWRIILPIDDFGTRLIALAFTSPKGSKKVHRVYAAFTAQTVVAPAPVSLPAFAAINGETVQILTMSGIKAPLFFKVGERIGNIPSISGSEKTFLSG